MPQRFEKRLILIVTCLALATVNGLHDYCLAQPRKSANAHAPTGSAKLLIERGKKELERKRYAAAVRLFSTAIRRDPASAEAYKLRGTAQDRLGVPEKAVHDFTKYIELKPRDPAGYIGRADTRNFNSEHAAALEDYNMAAKLAPSSPTPYLGRGLAYVGLQKYDEAIKEYQWALKLDPNNAEALGNMGVACMLAGRNLEAMSYFERALTQERDPHWRARIEKWTNQLLQQADAVRQNKRGPVRGTVGSGSRPLW
jgi:Flp pilus assembly protein TadD